MILRVVLGTLLHDLELKNCGSCPVFVSACCLGDEMVHRLGLCNRESSVCMYFRKNGS